MVFSAELMATLRCIELLTKHLMRRRIHICPDSRAATAALEKTTTESSLVWVCMQVLGKLSEFNKVTSVWIPVHQGIPGNKKADRLAKEGATEVPQNQSTAIHYSVDKKNH
jgi:ribonuclease HI